MFRIPTSYTMEMDFEEARNIITMNGSLLDGMTHMNEMWDRHCADVDGDDNEFYETWIYEVNAFNVVFAKMQPLFV